MIIRNSLNARNVDQNFNENIKDNNEQNTTIPSNIFQLDDKNEFVLL